jgi:hypothetical protein
LHNARLHRISRLRIELLHKIHGDTVNNRQHKVRVFYRQVVYPAEERRVAQLYRFHQYIIKCKEYRHLDQ